MTGDLVEAYHGVYTSSKEIMKNKQRHLYINMLDLLTRTTKAACSSVKDLITEDYVKFWYMEILPLVFDEDKTIQDNAVSAMETALQCLNSAKVQSLSEWDTIKSTIVEVYSSKLHAIRQVSNSNWYKIWCLLIRILDKEILKGATVINTFLSIVELGFRSSDYRIRAEAFICWKVLVEIFAKHNEIHSPKRIKLICIPLKSSQSKTLETAVNKFKVWWYFLCKLNDKIDEYSEIAFEPFLQFCFAASSEKNSTIAQGRNYPIVKQMAIACLIEMLGPSTKETQCLLEATGLERPDSPLISTSLMIKCGQAILNASVEATIMIAEKSPDRNKLFENLWKNLYGQILKTNELPLYLECFNKVKLMVETDTCKNEAAFKQYILYIIELIGTCKEFPFENHETLLNDVQKFCRIVTGITELVNEKQIRDGKALNETVINNVYNIEKYKASSKYWDIQKCLMENTMKEDRVDFTIKICIWKKLSECLKNYLSERIFEFRIEKNAEVVNKWLFWPLEKCEPSVIDESVLSTWRSLIPAASKAEGNCNFTRAVSGKLKNLFEMENQPPKLSEFLSIFITTLDVSFDKSSLPVEAFELINFALSKPVNKGETHNKAITALSAYINSLQENQIIDAFEYFKKITSTLVGALNSNAFTKHTFEEFKKTLSDKLKSNKAKEKKLLKEFKDLLKNNSNAFVIIPTPWSFNPDKLTEHQKEKMKEKRSDIPALYNDISHDMSHSQDIIKPWTPRKIVIAKGKNSEEIVIENKDSDVEMVEVANGLDLVENNNANKALDENLIKNAETATENGTEENNISLNKKPDVNTADTNEKETITNKGKEESEKKNKTILSKEQEELLKKYNIQIEDEKKKIFIARQLRYMEIDTVEGSAFREVQEKLRSKRSSKQEDNKVASKQQSASKRTRTNKDEKDAENEENKKKKTARKSLAFEKKDNSNSDSPERITTKENKEEIKSTSPNTSSEEMVPASQEPSQSVLSKKIALRKSTTSNSRPGTPNRGILNFVKSPDVTKQKQQIREEKDTPKKLCESSENSPKSADKLETPQKSKEFTPTKTALNVNSADTSKDTDLNLCSPKSKTADSSAKKSEQSQPRENGIDLVDLSIEDKEEEEEEEVIVVDDPQSVNENSKSPSKVPSVLRSSPRKSPFKKINEIPNPITDSELEKSEVNISKSSNNDDTKHPLVTASSETVASPLRSPLDCDTETQDNSKNASNKSIISSPEFQDADERNREFLSSTLNISPIVTSEAKGSESSKIEATKNLSNESSKNTSNECVKAPPMEVEKPGSPKRQQKIPNSLPSSPPDRRLTTAAESPMVKPKHTPQFTGRGAQLINMIRNRKLDVASKTPVNALMTAKIESKTSPEKASQGQHPQQNSPSKDEATVPTPLQHKDLLIFSKVLPSPSASPSASILKRKFRQDSFDDIESPANKRKRVSFHDPPVSVTKEYVKHAEEDRVLKPNFNRCLMPEKTSTPQINSSKHSFKRKSRVDSMLEIAKFADSPVQATEADVCGTDRNTTMEQTSVDMDSLKWNRTSDSQAQNEDDASLTPSPSLYFPDEAGVFTYIFEKYNIEDILEKYLVAGKTVTNKSVRAITKEISTAMTGDAKLRTNVLEMLSEKHPKEFLDHAIQENLSSVVCDRLNPSSVVEFVCEKAKINTGMRKRLLEQVQNMLTDKLSAEKYDFLLALLRNHQMSDNQVIDCIEVIVQRHKSKQVSEPVDASTSNS